VPRRRRNEEFNPVACVLIIGILIAFPAIATILALGIDFVYREWILIVAALAIAMVVVLGFVFRRRIRPVRRTAAPTANLLSILTLSTYGFEIYCRDLLEREGFTATVTKATGDEGVDVELRAKDGQIGLAQCKHGYNMRIGRPTLQQLYGEMINRRATFGFLLTTGTFTDEARTWARTKTITLVDRDELLRMASRAPSSGHRSQGPRSPQ
jgi:HJR/Mrr/RecB family endonuclease